MGLSDLYDNIGSQILVLDPLPSLNKAYSMILRVEKQKFVQLNFSDNVDNSAMLTKTSQGAYGWGQGSNKRDNQRKENGTCDFCKINSHTKDTYFKIHGYLDWYKQLKQDKVVATWKVKVNVEHNPLDEDLAKDNSTKWSHAISNHVQQEVTKFLKCK